MAAGYNMDEILQMLSNSNSDVTESGEFEESNIFAEATGHKLDELGEYAIKTQEVDQDRFSFKNEITFRLMA